MAKVTIGGTVYELPVLMYKQLKAIWPRMAGTFNKIQQAQADAQRGGAAAGDGVASMFMALDDAIFIVAQSLMRNDPTHTPDWVEEHIHPKETQALVGIIAEMMEETGLTQQGKPSPPVAA